MGFKYIEKGIWEYYKNSDPDKKRASYYYSTTNSEGKTIKIKSEHKDIRNVRAQREGMKLNKAEVKVNPTLNDIAANYLSSRTHKPMPEAEYKKYLKWCENGIGKKRVASITKKDVSQFIMSLEDANVQPRARLIQLKALLKAGGSTVPITIKKQDTKRKKRYFSDEELEIVFSMAEKINQELFVFMKMLLHTGQRPKNVLALDVIDIDFEKSRIDFAEIKGQEAEYIPLSNTLAPILKEWVADKHGKVFNYSHDYLAEMSQEIFDTFNKPLYYIDGMTPKEEKEARQSAYKARRHRWTSFYTLRHTCATIIVRKTGNLVLAQQILRHSDIKMTQVYAHVSEDDKKGAVDVI